MIFYREIGSTPRIKFPVLSITTLILIVSVGVMADTLRVNRMCDWDPMQADYLSEKNKYSIDDEDVGSAFHGYGNLWTK